MLVNIVRQILIVNYYVCVYLSRLYTKLYIGSYNLN